MNPADLEPTSTTPAITLRSDKLIIKGRSIPVTEASFYDKYIEWGKQLNSESLTVDIRLEYMNSSSIKKLLLLLKSLDSNKELGRLHINWYYEEGDDELKEHGMVFKKLLKRSSLDIISIQAD